MFGVLSVSVDELKVSCCEDVIFHIKV